jgi:hypothetical protein
VGSRSQWFSAKATWALFTSIWSSSEIIKEWLFKISVKEHLQESSLTRNTLCWHPLSWPVWGWGTSLGCQEIWDLWNPYLLKGKPKFSRMGQKWVYKRCICALYFHSCLYFLGRMQSHLLLVSHSSARFTLCFIFPRVHISYSMHVDKAPSCDYISHSCLLRGSFSKVTPGTSD